MDPPIDPSMIIWFVILSFGFAFVMVWTYAAIRPRFGAGINTLPIKRQICASSNMAELIE